MPLIPAQTCGFATSVHGQGTALWKFPFSTTLNHVSKTLQRKHWFFYTCMEQIECSLLKEATSWTMLTGRIEKKVKKGQKEIYETKRSPIAYGSDKTKDSQRLTKRNQIFPTNFPSHIPFESGSSTKGNLLGELHPFISTNSIWSGHKPSSPKEDMKVSQNGDLKKICLIKRRKHLIVRKYNSSIHGRALTSNFVIRI